ncbi:MAG: hypothetical protein QNK37_31735 [Acidobacteriota bacterium]|nr:hypothetical protein [Acidobacteriota bacterium]
MDIITWIKPNRSWGHLKIIGMSSEENSVDGIYQSFSVLQQSTVENRWDHNQPYTETDLKPAQVKELVTLADRITVPLFKTQSIPTDEPIGYGLTIDRFDYKISVEWVGSFEEQVKDIRELWMMVDMLVDRPLVPHQY